MTTIRRTLEGESLGRRIDGGWITRAAPAEGVELSDGRNRILLRVEDLQKIAVALSEGEFIEAEFDFWRSDGTP